VFVEFYDQFDKVSEDEYVDYGVTYDYSSLMHYGKYAFTKYTYLLPTYGREKYSIVPYVRPKLIRFLTSDTL